MKILSGSELAGFIKERQAKAVRGLRQAYRIAPRLAIIVTVDDPVIEIYMRLKKNYGEDILVDVDIHRIHQSDINMTIDKLNSDETVHGIIVQLPLSDKSETDDVVNRVLPQKDVDALGERAEFDPATPTAILWLLTGYGVELKGKNIVLVGKGKLVGQPLSEMLEKSGYNVSILGRSDDIENGLASAEVVVTATGVAGLISSSMIPLGSTVVDAGVAVEDGRAVGDLADDVYDRDDLKITPKKGGVGPLTVCALFENVITAAKRSAGIR